MKKIDKNTVNKKKLSAFFELLYYSVVDTDWINFKTISSNFTCEYMLHTSNKKFFFKIKVYKII